MPLNNENPKSRAYKWNWNIVGAVAITCALVPNANAVAFTPLDLSGVADLTPNFQDRALIDGPLSTMFDGTLIAESEPGVTRGNIEGDLALGGPSDSTREYQIVFDDNVLIQFAQEESIGSVTGPFDEWTISSEGVDFLFSDLGTPDINLISNVTGEITFTGTLTGDGNWSIVSLDDLTVLTIGFRNTAGGGNRGPLNISASIVSLNVAIDIKPGSDPNCFNINSHGVVPVAILGSADFDAMDIDPGSLLFGGLAVRVRGKKGPLCSFEDVNDDGFNDMVCHFEDDSSAWAAGDGVATVEGKLFNGTDIIGTDSICVVPE